MSNEDPVTGDTYVAAINITRVAPDRFRIGLDDASPEPFLIETGATGDGRFEINWDPRTRLPYDTIDFVFTLGEGCEFAPAGFTTSESAMNPGWTFGPAKISGAQCAVTARISPQARTFDYSLRFQAGTKTFMVGPNQGQETGPDTHHPNPITHHPEPEELAIA